MSLVIRDARGHALAGIAGRRFAWVENGPAGDALRQWASEGVPAQSCVADGETLREESKLVKPSDPLWWLAVLDAVERAEWTVEEK